MSTAPTRNEASDSLAEFFAGPISVYTDAQAREDGLAKAVMLPDNHGIKLAESRIPHEQIQLRATDLGTAPAGIHILTADQPATPRGIAEVVFVTTPSS